MLFKYKYLFTVAYTALHYHNIEFILITFGDSLHEAALPNLHKRDII